MPFFCCGDSFSFYVEFSTTSMPLLSWEASLKQASLFTLSFAINEIEEPAFGVEQS